MRGVANLVLAGLLAIGGASPVAAQSRVPLGQALQLERRGATDQAIRAYRDVLEGDPTNAAAILGLERLFQAADVLDSLLPVLDTALLSDPESRFVREVQLRVYAALGRPEQVAAAAAAWMQLVPASPDPFRQWAFVIAQSGDLEQALGILRAGRDQLGGDALAPEMARLLMASGDWASAAREWRAATVADEANGSTAIAGLSQAPATARERVLQQLMGSGPDVQVRRVAAELMVAWGRAEEGWMLLDGALPRNPRTAATLVRAFAERTRRNPSTKSALVRGLALERLAQLTEGDEAKRARLDAAQAFANAGELSAARRMLERVEVQRDAPQSDAAAAMATLIRVGAESGRLEEAEGRFREWEGRLGADDAAKLRETIAWGWMMQSELGRAERVLDGDSTVNALAVLGWIATYRGHLRVAVDRFRAAGPYAQSRAQATRRTALLAIIQRIEPDSAPAFGAALLRLAQGDTARAIDDLESAAASIPRNGGRADLLALAGDVAVANGDFSRGESLLLASLAAEAAGPSAPGTEYSLALVYVAMGRHGEAVEILEHLILTFSESAILPQARRLLDQVRGGIPQSRSNGTA